MNVITPRKWLLKFFYWYACWSTAKMGSFFLFLWKNYSPGDLYALSQLVNHYKRDAMEYLMRRRLSWVQEEVENVLLLKINQKMFPLSSIHILNVTLVLSGGHPCCPIATRKMPRSWEEIRCWWDPAVDVWRSSYMQLLLRYTHRQCDSVQAQREICVWLSIAAHPFCSGGPYFSIVAKIIKGHTSLTGIGHCCLFCKHHRKCRKKKVLEAWDWQPIGPEWVGGSSEEP